MTLTLNALRAKVNIFAKKDMNIFIARIAVRKLNGVSNMEELKKCPFCDSDSGYYMLERVNRALLFNFDGDPIGGTEDVTDYAGRRKRCMNCNKILPKKLFEEVMEK